MADQAGEASGAPDSDADGAGQPRDSADESAPGDGNEQSALDGDELSDSDSGRTGSSARSVVVPDRVYKTVTVFSTLFAVVTIVGGFVVLDRATNRATLSLAEADPVLALVGLGLIALGAVTYAFSTRFTAAGMGNAKDDTDEDSNNG